MDRSTSARQRHNVLIRHYGADHPKVVQARRALDLARTEDTIAEAIETAPPMDSETVSRLHALIPPPSDDIRPGGAHDAA